MRALSTAFRFVLLASLLVLAPVPAFAEDQEGCLECHGLAGLGRRGADTYRSYAVDGVEFNASPHGKIGCRGCHRDVVSIPHEGIKEVNCGMDCHAVGANGKPYSHEALYWSFMASVHGKNARSPITCRTCHQHDEGGSGVARDPVQACAACHLGPGGAGLKRETVARYFSDIHGRLRGAGGQKAPSCSDCHTRHAVLTPSAENSTLKTSRLPATCAGSEAKSGQRSCHREASTAHLAGMSPLAAESWRELPGGLPLYALELALALLLAVRVLAGLRRRP